MLKKLLKNLQKKLEKKKLKKLLRLLPPLQLLLRILTLLSREVTLNVNSVNPVLIVSEASELIKVVHISTKQILDHLSPS